MMEFTIEHATKDIEAHSDLIDEVATTLQHIAVRDMSPITEGESHQVFRRIDRWLMPIVCGSLVIADS